MDAREETILGCQGSAVRIAQRLCRGGVVRDGAQAGMLGATKAYDRWAGRSKFCTYAWPWIYGAVLAVASERDGAQPLEGDIAEPAPEESDPLLEKLAECLAGLPARQRRILQEHSEGLGFAAIAAELDYDVDRVKQLYAGGLTRLRQLMGDLR